MKIIQINCVYNTGSTGKIVAGLHSQYINLGHDSFVLYGRGKKVSDANIIKVSSEIEAKIHGLLSRLFGVDFGYSPIATKKAIGIIKKVKPDVVHLHCLNGHFINVFRLLDFLKKNKIKTILTLHAEIMHTAGCEHAMECTKWTSMCYDCKMVSGLISRLFRDDAKVSFTKMRDAFSNFDRLTIVGCSEWVVQRAKLSPIFGKSNCSFSYIHNDINYDVFHFKPSNLRDALGIPLKKKIVLTVTPNFLSPIKGSSYFLEIARRMPEYQFIVVGFNGNKEILPSNVLAIRRTENQNELANYYSLADCFISTSLRETLPTVCLEASACGCNVLAFDSGGASETIQEGHGDVVTPYDIDEYICKIKFWCSQQRNSFVCAIKKNNASESYLKLY